MIALALAVLLSFQDPSGDTFGNGSLAAPTAAVFRNLSSFDLLGVEVLDTPTLSFRFNFAALPNPLELPNGFSLPIIELYVGDETPGSVTLLPGSGMKLPGDASWHYAFRLTGDRAQAFIADDDTVSELSAAEGLELEVVDNVITLQTPLPRPESLTLYGLVGGYSPFSDSGWQALSATPSPWAFSSTEQTVPVVDVLAEDEGAQAQAVRTETLPAVRRAAPPAAPQENRWLLLVAGGVVVALLGVIGRFTVPKPEFRTGLPPEVYEQARAEAATPTPESTADELGTDAFGSETNPPPAEAAAPEPTVDLKSEPTAADLELEPAAHDPETADLEAWLSSEAGAAEPLPKEPIPELPETYPPGTGPAGNAVQLLELKQEDWPEEEEDSADLWNEPAQASDRT